MRQAHKTSAQLHPHVRQTLLLAATTLLLGLSGCRPSQHTQKNVVIYCALDLVFAKPVLKEFERLSGIRVDVKGDSEAAKTTGLAQLIRAEKSAPICDVFWNNEIIQTLALKKAHCLAPYESPSAASLPTQWRDSDHYWHAIAARARVIVYNPTLIKSTELPRYVSDLSAPEWKGQAVIAKPLFGTTATHISTLYHLWSPEKGREFLHALRQNKIGITDGNASVVRLVAAGEFPFGLTDTDDVFMGLKAGKNIAWATIGQSADHPGSLLIPNTVAMIADAPHPEAAKTLIDFLLSPAVEEKLRDCDSHQVPLHPSITPPPELTTLSVETIDYPSVAEQLDAVFEDVKKLWL